MSIRIDQNICIGCAECKNICPGNLIALNQDKKAYQKRPYDCWGCCACVKACSQGAISLILLPELDGKGESMTVIKEGSTYLWRIRDYSGKVEEYKTDTQKANEY